jgi:cyclic beta-1,2-glucan synthetase
LRWLDGIEDAVQITREALQSLTGERRGQTVTRRQLEDALDALAVALRAIPVTPAEVAVKLVELAAQADTITDMATMLSEEPSDRAGADVLDWAEAIRTTIRSHARDLESSVHAAPSLDHRLSALADLAHRMVEAMEFGFLFDPTRQLLSIGYLVTEGTLDPSCYDLLASEARLASFVAIAKGDVPAKHWFRLGRGLTPVDRGSALVSWSGSMFEYLMPSLVMRAPAGSVLERTSRLVVRRQMKYGARLGVPWGVSESAYNARDLELTYQYSNFGVPGLGLKRGLSEDTVIAPYATALAAMVDPQAAAQNFSRLRAAGGRGRYGYYEALDYTRTRVPEDKPVAVVRAYMAHHQGMTLVAIADALHDGAMRARFHSEPIIQATELLLQERMPRDVAVARPRAEEVKASANVRELIPPMQRRFHSPHNAVPRTHLLSNGRYSVMITAVGSGYSRWRDLAITRWREDVTCDFWGTYVFLRDAGTGAVWSAGYQPSGVEADSYEVEFLEDRVEIVRRDGTITTALEVAVS